MGNFSEINNDACGKKNTSGSLNKITMFADRPTEFSTSRQEEPRELLSPQSLHNEGDIRPRCRSTLIQLISMFNNWAFCLFGEM